MTPQVANKRVAASFLRNIHRNLNNLYKPERTYEHGRSPSTPSVSTTSATFVDVDSVELRLKIVVSSADGLGSSSGRDIVVTLNGMAFVSAGDTAGEHRLTVDGVGQGDATDGQFIIYWDEAGATPLPFYFIVRGLLPGEHEIVLQHRRVVGTGTVKTYIHDWHWIYAQET